MSKSEDATEQLELGDEYLKMMIHMDRLAAEDAEEG
jgi:hypothetical protein